MRSVLFFSLFISFFFTGALHSYAPSMTCPCDVIGIGSPSWDYVFHVDETFLEEHHLKKKDSTRLNHSDFFSLIRDAQKFETGFCCPGGSSANTLRGLASLGVNCGIIGVVGTDTAGRNISERLCDLGIHILSPKRSEGSLQIVTFVTPDNSRSFALHYPQSISITEDDLLSSFFIQPKIVHIQSYCLRSASCVEKTVQLAREYQKIISLDICDAALASNYRERLLQLLPSIDILFLNSEEAYALTHLPPKEALDFLGNFCPHIVLKLKDCGCLVAQRDRLISSPGMKAHTVDSTGAGDFFCSGYLFGILRGAPPEECAYYGNLCGAASVEHVGALIPSERWNELSSTMKSIAK